MQPAAPKEQEVEIERLVRALQQHVDVGVVPEVLRYLTDELEKRTLAERRAAELFRSEQLARTEAREERAANEAKSRFLAVLSHELRTPLQPVLGAASALLRDPRIPSDLLEDIRTIQRNVQLEARLIDDLLDLTRIMHGKLPLELIPVNMTSAIARAVEICESDTIAKKMRLSSRLDAKRTWAMVDPGRLQQILWNLIKNAVKFTPIGGEVIIHASNDENGKLIVRVSDNGIGIDPDMLPRIFDAFEQADQKITRQFGGLGLGLAISKMLAERHDGTLEAFSEGAGRGSTFTLTLATIDTPDPVRTPAGGIQRGSAVKPLRVLLVEDDEATAEIMSKLLRAVGHEVSIATDCAAAREEGQATGPFELLVCDIGLPDGSGLDLLNDLKPRCTRSIALTGYGTEDDVSKSRSAGFDLHLTKPVTLGQLVEAIDRLFV